MKLYELFKGTEYIGEFTLDEIISITGAPAQCSNIYASLRTMD